MTLYQHISLVYLLAINCLAYVSMCSDKMQAKRKRWRIPEKMLWGQVILGGALGIHLGMSWPLYHKAAKRQFVWGVPLILCFQVACALYYYLRVHVKAA